MASTLQRIFRRFRYGEPVIVVSGLPRSGTSMSMKMLEAAGIPLVQDGIRVADEDNPKGYFELERVKELDKGGSTGWLREARGKAVKIISFLLPYLPDENRYKILFMHRDLKEVLASQAKMLERRGEDSESTDERMTELYEKHLWKTKRLLKSSPHFDVLELHYREIIADATTHAKRIRDFLDLPLDVEKMAAVVDEQLYRNRS
jgi:hypothetical protein